MYNLDFLYVFVVFFVGGDNFWVWKYTNICFIKEEVQIFVGFHFLEKGLLIFTSFIYFFGYVNKKNKIKKMKNIDNVRSRQIGVEPMTFCLGNRRSIHWATGALLVWEASSIKFIRRFQYFSSQDNEAARKIYLFKNC